MLREFLTARCRTLVPGADFNNVVPVWENEMGWLARLFRGRQTLEQSMRRTLASWDAEAEAYEERKEVAIQKALAEPGVRALLKQLGLNKADLRSLHERLDALGVPHRKTAKAMRNADIIEWYFTCENQASGEVAVGLAAWVKAGDRYRPNS